MNTRILAEDWLISAHLARKVLSAPIASDPLPHIIVDECLPAWFYNRLDREARDCSLYRARSSAGRSDIDFRSDRTNGLDAFWRLQKRMPARISHLLLWRFRHELDRDYYAPNFGPLAGEAKALRHGLQFGRLMQRSAGYLLPAHRDPKAHALTALLYLDCDPTVAAHGTQLFACERFVSPISRTYRTEWDGIATTLAKVVEHVPNRFMAFVNTGAHGSSIPEHLEGSRTTFQFYAGPLDKTALMRIVDRLPDNLRQTWKPRHALTDASIAKREESSWRD